MDAIILAGGKGSRLDGVMPPYLKPIMPVHGKSLICRLFDQARETVDGRITIVVAPENALQISQILGTREGVLVVQRNAKGPGDALDLALSTISAEMALVLMGDNHMPIENMQACAAVDTWAVGYDVLDAETSMRFTRILSRPGTTEDLDIAFEEGPVLSHDVDSCRVWSGPLLLPTRATRKALSEYMTEDSFLGEHKIGPHLNKLVDLCGNPVLVKCQNVDIGIPEAAVQVTS